MKRNYIVAAVLIILVSLCGLFLFTLKPKQETPVLIGGQTDDHGCLIGAGYSWCEVKQKCLRIWEEPCVAAEPVKHKDWLLYQNKKFGFELKLPPTWEGYITGENNYATSDTISFSFHGNHQPFAIFAIIRYTPEEWQKIARAIKNSTLVLSQSSEAVLVCDGCCGIDNNTTGGGQFDNFQIARCKEGGDIMQTFTTLDTMKP